MKKLLMLALASLNCIGLSAGISEAGLTSTIFGKKTPYSKSQVGFELINKADHPIWFVVSNHNQKTGEGELTQLFKVEAATKGKRFEPKQLKIDIGNETQLAVWIKDPKDKAGLLDKYRERYKPISVVALFNEMILMHGDYKALSDKVYELKQGSTIYLTWDKKDFPRPQTGPLGGRLGKTDSNLSLEDNIKKEDIKDVSGIYSGE